MRRITLLLATLAVWTVVAAPPAFAVTSAWHLVKSPPAAAGSLRAITTAPPSRVLVAGAAGAVWRSVDGGATWVKHSPATAAGLNGIAFSSLARGVVVGARGTIFYTVNGANTWLAATVAGSPTGDFFAVAVRGNLGLAVGAAGLVAESTDYGATWTVDAAPVTAALRSVALAADGGAVVTGDGGALVARANSASGWTVLDESPDTIGATAVDPRLGLGGGALRLFAARPSLLIASADGISFAPVTTSLPLYSGVAGIRALATLGAPAPRLLVADEIGTLSTYRFDSGATASGRGPLKTVLAAAGSDQSVGYVLSPTGGVERTLSAGLAPLLSSVNYAHIAYGRHFSLRGTVRVAAPGKLALQRSYFGTRTWTTLVTRTWTAATPAGAVFTVTPSVNAGYRLVFVYGGKSAAIGPVRTVTVRPLIAVKTLRLRVRLGATYKISGSVRPALRGRSVEVYTDRGGRWHRIAIGGFVKLRNGLTFTSRAFGTPKVETYHLRAYLRADRFHAASWSATMTVTVHR